MSGDSISRVICDRLNLRAYTVTSTETVRTITALHGTTPNATVALGRTINAAALLSATLKPESDQNVSLRLSGTGPAKEILAQADAKGNLRGFVANPAVDLDEDIGGISFSRTIGAGTLTVTKDLGLREPYKSIMPLRVGEIAADMAYYLTESEQIPSAMILGMHISRDGMIESSGGLLIQTYPETESAVIGEVESRIKAMPRPLSEELRRGTGIFTVLSGLFGDEEMRVVGTSAIRSACRCGKEMLASVLLNLPTPEIEAMIDEDDGAELSCSFCTKRYHFTGDELGDILAKKRIH